MDPCSPNPCCSRIICRWILRWLKYCFINRVRPNPVSTRISALMTHLFNNHLISKPRMLPPELDSRKIKGTNPTFKEPTSGEMDKWIVSTQWNKGYINISRQFSSIESPTQTRGQQRGWGFPWTKQGRGGYWTKYMVRIDFPSWGNTWDEF